MSKAKPQVKNYSRVELGDVLHYEQPTKYIVNSTEYSNEYKTPVLTAGKSFIRGYTDEKNNIFPIQKLPVIIFDDFTTAIKFVDFPFKVKSSAMKILHAKKDIADIKYLFYLMQTIELNHVTHKRYWISEYSQIKIPLPPLVEQKKIVAKLEKLLGKIKEAKRLRAETQEAAQSLPPAELHKIFEEGKKKGWEHVQLKSIAIYPTGLTYSPHDISSGGKIVLRSSNIQNNELSFLDVVRVNKIIKENLFVRDGDILMCVRNGSKRLIGKTAMIQNLKEKMTFGAFMTIVRSDYGPFLYWFFKSRLFFDQFDNGGGPMINQITKYMLDKIMVPLPSIAEQKKIVARLDSLSEKIKKLQEHQKSTATDFTTLENSILHRAFSGELVK